jgi:hypothetical protein
MAKRYGRLPHEILELDPYQLSVAFLALSEGVKFAASEAGRSKNPIFPVWLVGP